jgi:HEAT repeat protein
MPGTSAVDKIRALLASDAHERQIAAAIVLGEIGARDAEVIDALASAAAGGVPPVQRHALEALARLAAGAKAARKLMPRVLACLASRDDAVRRAAVDAAVAFGDDAVAPVRQRLAETADALERRALDEVLGRVGGKDAFAALLVALDTPDVDAARAAALAVRQRVKETQMSPREKLSTLAQVTKFVQAKAKAKSKDKPASPAAVAGGLKILGYLEEPAAVPTLLAFARDGRKPNAVREEAIVALRFVARGKVGARVAAALQELAERAPAELARPALYTMASLEIPAALVPRLKKLALGGEPERALLAIERLAQVALPAGADALAAVLTDTKDRMRAEAAASALGARAEAAFALARALIATADADRAALLARLLRPRLRTLIDGGAAGKKLAKALVAAAIDRVAAGGAGSEALLPLAREIDRDATGAGLRAVAARLQKRKDGERALAVLRLVGHANDATPDDGYALAAAALRAGRRDEALAIVQQLVDRGFDLAAALRRDRMITPEQRYQVGFSLVERRHPAGEEVLTDLAGSGRSKVASMAKAKLKSAGF